MQKIIVTACDNMLPYRIVCVFLITLPLITTVESEKHLNANGPFGKRHAFHNEPSPYACDRGAGITSSIFRRRSKVVQDIQVSKTIYMSSEEIQITWTPISASCKDDFIGIYYIDIPLTSGKTLFSYGLAI